MPRPLRSSLAIAAAKAAAWASRRTGRGEGSMIGGLIALKIDPRLVSRLTADSEVVLVTGTNGKSTTTRMTAAALSTVRPVATQADGANMDAGIAAALIAHPSERIAVLEVDELHVPHIARQTSPRAIVLLNLSRDQLDRVGEINHIERELRAAVNAHPDAVIVANCDDVLISSVAFDAPNVVWVAAGTGWANDSLSDPRSGEPIARSGEHWSSTGPALPDGRTFARPTPDWWFDDTQLFGPDGVRIPLALALPGRANRANAAQAVAVAVALGADPAAAAAAVGTVDDIAGRYATLTVGPHTVRMLLAKNPAGWQEAMSMIDPDAPGLVIAVNGQAADGEDLSWLWDVQFERFAANTVLAAGERGADLSVRLTYADAPHQLIPDPVAAIAACPPGRVEVLANYTAFRDLKHALARSGAQAPIPADTRSAADRQQRGDIA